MHLAWHDFIFDLPDEWEVTRYSISAPAGRMEFTGRNGPLGRVSWEICKRFPDEERILTEYHRRYLRQYDKDSFQGFSGIRTCRVGKFHLGYREEGEPCQAVAHFADRKQMLMWVFPSYSRERLNLVWRPILESFKANDSDWREWAAFGIQCRLPAAFELESVSCKPADVWLAFEHKNLHKVNLHRWGLPREMLRGSDLETFFRACVVGHGGQILNSRAGQFRGMESVEITHEQKGTRGMDRLYASTLRGGGRIWHNREEKRLYAFLQAAPAKVKLLDETRVIAR